jgi:hypothetical protein
VGRVGRVDAASSSTRRPRAAGPVAAPPGPGPAARRSAGPRAVAVAAARCSRRSPRRWIRTR